MKKLFTTAFTTMVAIYGYSQDYLPTSGYNGTLNITPSSFTIGSSTATNGNSLTLQSANSNYLLKFKNSIGASLGGFFYDGINMIADGPSWKFDNPIAGTSAMFSENGSFGALDIAEGH